MCRLAWIVRDHRGNTLFLGRIAFSYVNSQREMDLLGMYWAVDSMANMKHNGIIFESHLEKAREAMILSTSSIQLQNRVLEIERCLARICSWSLNHISVERNQAAMKIALSVSQEHRTQSYIATKGPHGCSVS